MKKAFYNADNIDGLTVWAAFYLVVVATLSLLKIEYTSVIFAIYLIMAIPFIYSIEHFLALVILLETISYYFFGAGEGIWSLCSILMIITCLSIVLPGAKKAHISLKNIVPMIGLAVIAVISYKQSKFGYTNGLYRIIYLVVLTFVVGNLTKLDIAKLTKALRYLAMVLVVCYYATVFITGTRVDNRLTLSSDVNTNTFGMSCAQLATILFVSFYTLRRKRYLVACGLVFILAYLSGSRGALLSFIGTGALIMIIDGKRKGKLTGTMFKTLVVALILLGLFGVLSSFISFDTGRYALSQVLSQGTALRIEIYAAVIPYVFSNGYYLFGYGPGHECSRRVIKQLIYYNYSHTHNTLLEAFCELGIGGLILTSICIITSVKNALRCSAKNPQIYVILGMLVCILANSLAESYFCDAIFWLILAVCRNDFIAPKTETQLIEKEARDDS